MNGHGAHRRQEGSQLAAEPACSRRVRAPSKPWGDGCFVASRGSYDKAGYVGVGGRFIRSGHGVPLGRRPDTPCPPPLRLINSVEQTSTRPSHGKVLASLSFEPLGVCSLVRRQIPVGHGVFMPCHKRIAPARTSPRGYNKWWSTAATPDSTRMTQVSLFIALNNFVPLHCATWILGVPG